MNVKRHYEGHGAYKYGLKISSPFIEDFSRVAEGGGEVLYVAAGTHKTMKNDLSAHRLILVSVEKGGTFEYVEHSSGASVKSDIHIFLRGRGARAKITARYKVDGAMRLDILHKVYHEADGTVSNIEARGTLAGESHVIYRGGIDMKEGSKALSGKEDARFLLLSKTAKIDAIPALDIAAREVTSNHALSISRLSDSELFYPKSRGYDDAAARELVLEGFLK